MNRTVFILNGPNLNLLGRREPHIYGHTTLDQIRHSSEKMAEELDLVCDFRQTNHEGVMVDWIQEAFEQGAALIINPAGFSFHSIPVLDALKRFLPVVKERKRLLLKPRKKTGTTFARKVASY